MSNSRSVAGEKTKEQKKFFITLYSTASDIQPSNDVTKKIDLRHLPADSLFLSEMEQESNQIASISLEEYDVVFSPDYQYGAIIYNTNELRLCIRGKMTSQYAYLKTVTLPIYFEAIHPTPIWSPDGCILVLASHFNDKRKISIEAYHSSEEFKHVASLPLKHKPSDFFFTSNGELTVRYDKKPSESYSWVNLTKQEELIQTIQQTLSHVPTEINHLIGVYAYTPRLFSSTVMAPPSDSTNKEKRLAFQRQN